MWEFPHGPVNSTETHEAAATRMLPELTGLRANLGPELVTVHHAVNHHHITLLCFEARYRSGRFHSDFYTQGQWVETGQLAAFPFSVPQRRVARAVTGDRQYRLF